MTARTRSAKRSNPQRMSVASLAIQIRALCARSIACNLAARSLRCLHYHQQRSHMFGIESWHHHQASPILQPDFDPRAPR